MRQKQSKCIFTILFSLILWPLILSHSFANEEPDEPGELEVRALLEESCKDASLLNITDPISTDDGISYRFYLKIQGAEEKEMVFDCSAFDIGPITESALKPVLSKNPNSAVAQCRTNEENTLIAGLLNIGATLKDEVDKEMCEANKNKSCMKDIACNVARSVLSMATLGLLPLKAGILKSVDTDTELKEKGCSDMSQGDCATAALSGIVRNLFLNIEGLYMLGKAAVYGVGSGIKSAYNGIANWFSSEEVEAAENASSDQLHVAAQLSDEEVEEAESGPIAFFMNLGSKLGEMVNTYMAETFACEQWSGVPHASTCLKVMSNFECANCNQKMAAWCGAIGLLAGEITTAFVTGGVLNIAGKAGKLAGMNRLFSGVFKGSGASKPGAVSRIASSIGGGALKVGEKVFGALYKVPGLKQYLHATDKAFEAGLKIGKGGTGSLTVGKAVTSERALINRQNNLIEEAASEPSMAGNRAFIKAKELNEKGDLSALAKYEDKLFLEADSLAPPYHPMGLGNHEGKFESVYLSTAQDYFNYEKIDFIELPGGNRILVKPGGEDHPVERLASLLNEQGFDLQINPAMTLQGKNKTSSFDPETNVFALHPQALRSRAGIEDLINKLESSGSRLNLNPKPVTANIEEAQAAYDKALIGFRKASEKRSKTGAPLGMDSSAYKVEDNFLKASREVEDVQWDVAFHSGRFDQSSDFQRQDTIIKSFMRGEEHTSVNSVLFKELDSDFGNLFARERFVDRLPASEYSRVAAEFQKNGKVYLDSLGVEYKKYVNTLRIDPSEATPLNIIAKDLKEAGLELHLNGRNAIEILQNQLKPGERIPPLVMDPNNPKKVYLTPGYLRNSDELRHIAREALERIDGKGFPTTIPAAEKRVSELTTEIAKLRKQDPNKIVDPKGSTISRSIEDLEHSLSYNRANLAFLKGDDNLSTVMDWGRRNRVRLASSHSPFNRPSLRDTTYERMTFGDVQNDIFLKQDQRYRGVLTDDSWQDTTIVSLVEKGEDYFEMRGIKTDTSVVKRAGEREVLIPSTRILPDGEQPLNIYAKALQERGIEVHYSPTFSANMPKYVDRNVPLGAFRTGEVFDPEAKVIFIGPNELADILKLEDTTRALRSGELSIDNYLENIGRVESGADGIPRLQRGSSTSEVDLLPKAIENLTKHGIDGEFAEVISGKVNSELLSLFARDPDILLEISKPRPSSFFKELGQFVKVAEKEEVDAFVGVVKEINRLREAGEAKHANLATELKTGLKANCQKKI